MRALRDSLSAPPSRATLKTTIGAAFSTVMAVAACACSAATPATTGTGSPWFPLAVGNSWTYRCSAEGKYQFDKTLSLGATTVVDGVTYFRAEVRIKGNATPSVHYLRHDVQGGVLKTVLPRPGDDELLVTASPKIGDAVGAGRVAAWERVKIPSSTKLQALRIENFSFDDPKLSADKRLEWQGRFYAKGVGPVSEADGAGGECLLSKYRVKQSA